MATSIAFRTPLRHLVRDQITLLGTPIDRIARSAVEEWIEAFITSGAPHQIITANLDFVAIARRRPDFAQIIEDADLVVCDGKPLQWASQLQGEAIPARVTGMDLVLTAAHLSATHGYRIFFMGAAPGVADRAARALEELIPGVVMAGTCSPQQGPFDADEDARIVASIRAARPDALFVALGAPRQDEWIHAHLGELGVPLCAGIGGVFNFLAGETRRAPEWIQHAGMEWAFRLAQEPSRLWKRYLVDDLPVFFELLTQQAAARWQTYRARLAASAMSGGDGRVTAIADLPARPRAGVGRQADSETPLRQGMTPRLRIRKRSCR